MSSLYKLSIQGIRSFDCEQPETIQFGFPLTLICGQNGCGKTTIIECLKYATTGDLPPNSKGGAFVMDPEIVGRNNVTAQVKLAFKDVNGRSLITTRSMQLSKRRGNTKTNSNTFKTLEGQLAIIDKGTKRTLSTKNAELDTRIPIHVGASKAILDYVIFCHQDDSLWPLSEASVLKKRFDEIFEASKFTKVLENLKTIKKDMANDIKLIEQSVNHLKIDKERSKRVHDKLREINDQFERVSAEITDLKIEIESKDSEAESLFATNQGYQQTLARYDQLTHSCSLLNQQLERLKSTVEVTDETYEELVEKKANFSTMIQDKEHQVEAEKSNRDSIKQRIINVTDTFNEGIRQEAVLKSKQVTFEANLSRLQHTIELMSQEFHFSESSSNDEIVAFEKFEEDLKERLERLRKEHSNLVTFNREVVETKRNSLQGALNSVSGKRQDIKYIDSEVAQGKRKIAELSDRLTKLEGQSQELDQKKVELETHVESLDIKKKENMLSELDSKIDSEKSKLARLEFELEEVDRNLGSAHRLSDLRARHSLTKEKNDIRTSQFQKITDFVASKYIELFGVSLERDDMLQSFQEKLDEINKTHSEQREAINEWKNRESTHKHEIKRLDHSVEEIEKEIERHQQSIIRVMDIKEVPDYEKVLSDLEQDYNTTFENLNSLEITKQFKIKALQVAEASKHCHLCQRKFEGTDLDEFLLMINESLGKNHFKKYEDDFESVKSELEAMKGIYNDVLQYRKLNIQSEQFVKQRKGSHDELSNISKKLAFKLQEYDETSSKLNGCNSLSEKMRDISRFTEEIKANEHDLQEIEAELKGYGSSAISVKNLQESHQKQSLEVKLLRQNINNLSEEKYLSSRDISRFESKVKDMKLHIANLEKSLSDSINIKATLKDLNEMVVAKTREKKNCEESLNSLESSKDELQRELNQSIDKSENDERVKIEVIEQIQNTYGSFKSTLEDVQKYKAEEEPRLKTNKDELAELRNALKELRDALDTSEEKIQVLEKDVKYSSNLEYKTISNIDYRDIQRELDLLDEEMMSLDVDNARMQRDEYQKISSQLREELSELNSEYSRKSGEVMQMKNQISSLQRDLETEYKNVDANYHEEWIKLQTNLLISNDIQTYSKALDNAIMKYHSMKMKDINRILKELWSQTYKGTDIDTIAIKSDVNVQAKGNRSYNYRVVMNKSNAELDMRGRCSAGQKVLTSILIRLALAECFGANCGMIALDEPTTNLDQENAESLAQALNHIISFRKNQRNFQLIVITHDEKFLSHINGDQFTDNFYRIQRDENQRSTIFSLPISKIHN